MNDIVIYSTGCPACKFLEQRLKDKHINFTINNDEEIMKQKGIVSVPVMEVNSTLLNYKQSLEWLDKVDTNGINNTTA